MSINGCWHLSTSSLVIAWLLMGTCASFGQCESRDISDVPVPESAKILVGAKFFSILRFPGYFALQVMGLHQNLWVN